MRFVKTWVKFILIAALCFQFLSGAKVFAQQAGGAEAAKRKPGPAQIVQVDLKGSFMMVQPADGSKVRKVKISNKTLLYKDMRKVTLDSFHEGEKVLIIADNLATEEIDAAEVADFKTFFLEQVINGIGKPQVVGIVDSYDTDKSYVEIGTKEGKVTVHLPVEISIFKECIEVNNFNNVKGAEAWVFGTKKDGVIKASIIAFFGLGKSLSIKNEDTADALRLMAAGKIEKIDTAKEIIVVEKQTFSLKDKPSIFSRKKLLNGSINDLKAGDWVVVYGIKVDIGKLEVVQIIDYGK
ncbi:MAG: hypothetical protein M1536_00010 [Firmicutes bacterium]|nr:hypothetical protein [Bacillota bacterium]